MKLNNRLVADALSALADELELERPSASPFAVPPQSITVWPDGRIEVVSAAWSVRLHGPAGVITPQASGQQPSSPAPVDEVVVEPAATTAPAAAVSPGPPSPSPRRGGPGESLEPPT